jgi:hypothetical protein
MTSESVRQSSASRRRLPVEVQRKLWRRTWERLLAPVEGGQQAAASDLPAAVSATTTDNAAQTASSAEPAPPGAGHKKIARGRTRAIEEVRADGNHVRRAGPPPQA